MIKRPKSLCGEIHFSTLLVCGGCIFPVYRSHPEIADMLREKWAFAVILIMLVLCVQTVLRGKLWHIDMNKILKTFVLMGIVQIIIAFLQLVGIIPSFHQFFRFTATFRNPAIFSMMLTLCLPICIFYYINSANKRHAKWFFLTFLVALWIVMSESRACMIAATCSSFTVAFLENARFRNLVSCRRICYLFLLCGIIALIGLYFYKRDSADGRILIWLVSFKMIATKPILGWGEDVFAASYMPYQAMFLQENEESRFAYLADNITHPFNEFLLLAIKYGILGVVVLFGIIALIAVMIRNNRGKYMSLHIAILLTVIILSMFTYVFTIPIVWICVTFIICSIVCDYCMSVPKSRLTMPLLLYIPILLILFNNRNILNEWRWHNVQKSSASVNEVLHEYRRLYTHLKTNSSFLYNYGALLHYNGFYEESQDILIECTRFYDDYNVRLLMADNYRQMGDGAHSIKTFEYAQAMVPCRFLPLYHIMKVYEDIGDYTNARHVAKRIIEKPAKIDKSPSVQKIKQEAKMLVCRLDCK